MEKFESTKMLMERLKSGVHKRLVMENDEDAFDPKGDKEEPFEEAFGEVFEKFKERTSRPDKYDYLGICFTPVM